jgi:penicillin-binding protein 1C
MKDGVARIVWPAELEEFASGRSVSVARAGEVSIVSPLPGAKYILAPLGGEQRAALRAEGAELPVYWFVGGEFVGKQTDRTVMFWDLKKGVHTVSLVDGAGRTASSRFTVEAPGTRRPGQSPSTTMTLTLAD